MTEEQQNVGLEAIKQLVADVQTESELLKILANNSDIWNFTDAEDLKEAIGIVVDAEVRLKEIPIRLKELDIKPQRDQIEIEWSTSRRITEIEEENKKKIVEIQEENKREVAEITADMRVQISKAPYRWRTHFVWILGILAGIALIHYMGIPIAGG